MREVPPIAWRAVLIGGAVALLVSLLLSMAFQPLLAAPLGVAAGGAAAGWLARSRGAFHGGLVAVLWIASEALAEPFRPVPPDVAVDLAQTVLADVVRLALGILFGWLGGFARR